LAPSSLITVEDIAGEEDGTWREDKPEVTMETGGENVPFEERHPPAGKWKAVERLVRTQEINVFNSIGL
jgi:hypothetical protein